MQNCKITSILNYQFFTRLLSKKISTITRNTLSPDSFRNDRSKTLFIRLPRVSLNHFILETTVSLLFGHDVTLVIGSWNTAY